MCTRADKGACRTALRRRARISLCFAACAIGFGLAAGGVGPAALAAPEHRLDCSEDAQTLWQADTLGVGRSRRLSPLGDPPRGTLLDVSADARWVAYNLDGTLRLATVEGTSAQDVARDPAERPGTLSEARWAPDGGSIAFVTYTGPERRLYVVRRDGTKLRQISDRGIHPSWAPNSKSLAFVERGRVVVASLTTPHRLVIAPTSGHPPVWSPQGHWIAYSGPRALRVHLIRRDGSGDRTIVPKGQSASWSPDERFVALYRTFRLPPSPPPAFAIADLRGRLVRSVETGHATDPEWSPRGNQLAYGKLVARSGRLQRTQIFSIRTDGTHRRQLSHDAGLGREEDVLRVMWVTKGSWAGRRVLYTRAACP